MAPEVRAFLNGYMSKSAAASGQVVETKRARDYGLEYKRYHGNPVQVARRSARNKSRRLAAQLGMVSKGDGQDVDHIDGDPLNQAEENIRVMGMSENRSRKHNTEKLKVWYSWNRIEF